MGGCNQALLSQRQARPSAQRDWENASDVSAASMVQSVRWRRGGRDLWQLCHAEICRDRLHDRGCARCNNTAEVPASSGAAQFEQTILRSNQSGHGGDRTYDERRHHCGRYHHQRTFVHQERREEAGSWDAPDEKGQWVEVRNEVPHRCRRRKRSGSYNCHHGSQYTWYYRSFRADPRRWRGGIWWLWLSGNSKAEWNNRRPTSFRRRVSNQQASEISAQGIG